MTIANHADSGGAGNFSIDDHPSETELLQYLEGGLAAAEAGRMEKHLAACTRCFQVVLAARANEAHPFTAQELEEGKRLATWTPEQHLAKLRENQKKIIERNRHSNASSLGELPTRPVSNLKIPAYWRPLAVAALLVLALAAGLGGARYFQTDYQVAQAAKLLQEQHHVFIKDARLSGGYGSSGISVLMGEEDEQNYVQRSRARLEKAMAHGERSRAALQLLAQIFIIEKDYAAADSILRDLQPGAENSPALLNDLGVYYFERRDWPKAEEYFSAAIQAGAKFPEARYNLALVKIQTGARDQAIDILNEYLRIEKDPNWQNAARGLQDELRN